jgi:primosomal protein N' (replication factor Y)
VDIIIGTQMLVKGHHFPLLTLVVVLDGDSGLMGPDFRGAERTYQMLHQVAGRAGRDQKPGHVFIQTFTPQNALMQCLSAHNRDQFYNLEIRERETHQMPPFRRIAGLIVSDLNPGRGEAAVKHMARNLPYDPHVQILGPVEAPLFRLQGRYRWRFLVSAPSYGSNKLEVWP